MIRLNLTRQESEFLLQWLENKPQPELGHSLQQKVVAACQQALQPQTCPICGHTFDQLKIGRTGRYCSNACKQKAYRQRRYDLLRRSYPPPKT